MPSRYISAFNGLCMIVYSITDFKTILEKDEGGENFIIVSFAKSLFDPINCLI